MMIFFVLFVVRFLFFFEEKKVKSFSSLYLKKKTQAHQTLRFFYISNTSRQ